MVKHNIADLHIDLKKNEVSDIFFNITYYAQLSFVETLTVTALEFDFEDLHVFNKLKTLRIGESSKNKINFRGLIELEKISLRHRKNIENFQDLVNLKDIYISHLKNENLLFLKECHKIESLIVTRGTCVSLEGLNVKKLKHLDLWSCNKLSDFSVLEKSENLIILY